MDVCEEGGRELTGEGLPFACGTRVTGEFKVGLETEFTVKRRFDLPLVGAITGEELTLQQRLRLNKSEY